MKDEDPIAEIRRIRHEIGAQFDHDFDKISDHIKRKQKQGDYNFANLPHVEFKSKHRH